MRRGWLLGYAFASVFAIGCHNEIDLPGAIAIPTPVNLPPSHTPIPIPVLGPITVMGAPETVNECYPILSSEGEHLLLMNASSAGLPVGTQLLLMQVKDAFLTSSSVSSADTIVLDSQPTDAGFARLTQAFAVTNSSGGGVPTAFVDVGVSTLTVGSNRLETTDTRTAQACTVPLYSSVTISSSYIEAPFWTLDSLSKNAWAGGVVSFQTDQLTVGGSGITAFFGLSGGLASTASASMHVLATETDGTEGGQKGQGIDARSQLDGSFSNGRGHLGNGAGGGNASGAGGGGGGGAGHGGMGGFETGLSANAGTAGTGGAGITIDSMRLVMGGAGGGGHSVDAGHVGGIGGPGGGIVFVIADKLSGGGPIAADGSPGGTATGGAGGGGAGGTIYLRISDGAGYTGVLSATGGFGGSTTSLNYGPGGGGGGGTIIVSPGVGGSRSNAGRASGTESLGTTHGATAGGLGRLVQGP